MSGNCGHRFFRCSRRGSFEKPQADADEPDEQAENGHAPEAVRDPRGRHRRVGKSRRRRADTKRGAVNVVRILDDRVVHEGANVRARAVIEGVRPGAPSRWHSLRQAVPLFCLLPHRVFHARCPSDMDGDRPRTEHHVQRAIRRRCDPQAEEASSEEPVRCGVYSGLHRRMCCNFQKRQERDWSSRPDSVSCRHLGQPVDELNLSPNVRTAHPPRLSLPDHVHGLVALDGSPRRLTLAQPLLSLVV